MTSGYYIPVEKIKEIMKNVKESELLSENSADVILKTMLLEAQYVQGQR